MSAQVKFQDVANVETQCITPHDSVQLRTLCVKSAPNEGTTHLTVYTYAEVVVVNEYHAMILRTVLPNIWTVPIAVLRDTWLMFCLQKRYDELGF